MVHGFQIRTYYVKLDITNKILYSMCIGDFCTEVPFLLPA